jgi:hypothetical protein
MRLILVMMCCAFGLSASAQWYHSDLNPKKHLRFPPIPQVKDHSIDRLPVATLRTKKIQMPQFERTEYSMEAAERQITKTAQHNMRFREYNDASYNFSELANLYLHQSRFTEAKWFFLQSNNISRAQSDDRHTILNLIGLATIKALLGDCTQAQQDLTEAHDLALARGFRNELLQIEKKIQEVKQSKATAPKPELRYAETPAGGTKAG